MMDSTGFYELLAWLEENKKRVIMAAAGLVIAGSGIAIYRWKVQQTELAASDALLELRTPMNAPEKTPPATASAYLKVASTFPSTSAAERALLLGAGTLFADGKYQDARTQFENFLQRHGDHPLAATAAFGRAASLETQGQHDEALRGYQDVMARYPNAALLDEVRLAMARLYELKKQPQLALQTYEEITRTNLMSAKSAEANTRKEQLLAKYPDLAKANAPAVPATNAVQTPASTTSSTATNTGSLPAVVSVTNTTPALGTNTAVPSTNAVQIAPSPKP